MCLLPSLEAPDILHAQSEPCACKAHMLVWSKTEERQRLRYTHRVIKRAFEEFVDINKVLQLSSSVNMA